MKQSPNSGSICGANHETRTTINRHGKAKFMGKLFDEPQQVAILISAVARMILHINPSTRSDSSAEIRYGKNVTSPRTAILFGVAKKPVKCFERNGLA